MTLPSPEKSTVINLKNQHVLIKYGRRKKILFNFGFDGGNW